MSKHYYEQKADEKNYFALIKYEQENELNYSAHFHDAIEMVFVLEGEASLCIDGDVVNLKKGDIGVASSYRVHYGKYAKGSRLFVLVMNSVFAQAFIDEHKGFFPAKLEYNSEAFDKICALFAINEQLNVKSNANLTQGFCSMLLGVLLQYYKPTDAKNYSKGSFAKILNYIEQNYNAPLSLTSVAKEFGYAPNYFSSLFHSVTNKNFCEHINSVRYKKALLLLQKEGKLRTVESVAFECGFESMNTFYRAKKKFEKS